MSTAGKQGVVPSDTWYVPKWFQNKTGLICIHL